MLELNEWFEKVAGDAKSKSSSSYAWHLAHKRLLELILDPNLSLSEKVFEASLHGAISNPISSDQTRGLLSKLWWKENSKNFTNSNKIQDSKILSKKYTFF